MDVLVYVLLGAFVVSNAGWFVLLDRERTRASFQLSEMASRVQHPDLVTHKAAVEYDPRKVAAGIESDPRDDGPDDLAMAGRVVHGDGSVDEEETATPPVPDPRVR